MPARSRARRSPGNTYPNLAAQFASASSQYATIPDNTDLSMGAVDLTMALWVNLASLAVDQVFAAKWLTTGNQRSYLLKYLFASNRFQFALSSNGTAATTLNATTFGAPATDTWHFICCRFDNVNDLMRISVNAGTADTAAFVGDLFDNTSAFTLGTFGDLSQFLNGRLDCAGVWKSAPGSGGHLSDAQVAQLYNGGIGMAYRDLPGTLKAPLIAYYNLDGNFLDSHGQNHLTATNGPTFASGKR